MLLDELRGGIDGPWFNFAVAMIIGLLIGLERERSKGVGPARRPAGIRTFVLGSLVGAIGVHLGGVPLLAVATGGMAAVTAIAYLRGHDADPGLTTETALIAVPLLGGLAMSEPLLAAGLGAVIAAVLAAKAPLHGFVTRVLSGAEVRDSLVFAIAALVIWPLLPNRYLGPLQAINPHGIWLLILLVLALGACGHIATRVLGTRFGLPVAGLASGFVSSTATIASMAGRAANNPASLPAAVAGAAFSTVATFAQMALVLAAVSQATLATMAPALAAGGIVAGVYGLAFMLRGGGANGPATPGSDQVFSFGTAVGLAVMMAVMLVAAAFLKDRFGEAGVIAGAAVAGFIDTHSAAISVASLAAGDQITSREAVAPILAAMTSNALAKIAMATGTRSTAFAVRIIPGLALSIAAAWAVAVPMILR